MKKIIDKAAELLNLETHQEAVMNDKAIISIPVHVVRSVAHELLVLLREYEVINAQVLLHLDRAKEVLTALGRIDVSKE